MTSYHRTQAPEPDVVSAVGWTTGNPDNLGLQELATGRALH